MILATFTAQASVNASEHYHIIERTSLVNKLENSFKLFTKYELINKNIELYSDFPLTLAQ